MIYVGSYTSPTPSCPGAHGKGISVYDLDWKLQKIIACNNPSYLLIHDDCIYSVNEFENGSVTNLDSGEITLTGSNPCHLEWWNDKLVVCNYDGDVKIGDNIIEATHPHCSVIYRSNITFGDSSTDNIIINDLGKDTVTEYNSDLNIINQLCLPAGTGPRHMVVYGENGYVTNELSGGVTVFSLRDWKIIQIVNGPFRPSHLQVCDGYLYVAYRQNNTTFGDSPAGTISVFDIKPNGTIKNIQDIDCGGKNPRHFNIFQGKLAVANQDSDNITVFTILSDGKLKYEKDINCDTPVFITFVI